jgi:hypothetical protein
MDKRTNSGEYWDGRLIKSERNPFPLAPRNLVEDGIVNPRNYELQNTRFGNYFGQLMRSEISQLPREHSAIQIFGVGLCRDYMWMKPAIMAGFDILIRDISLVACNKAQGILRRRFLARPGTTFREPGGLAWGRVKQEQILPTEIDPSRTVAVHASQFVEHQDCLGEFMRVFGKFIRHPGRRVYLVLPFLEDNPPDAVKWDSAKPPYAYEWQGPLVAGFGGRPNICILGRHKYFDRTYTCVRISGT